MRIQRIEWTWAKCLCWEVGMGVAMSRAGRQRVQRRAHLMGFWDW